MSEVQDQGPSDEELFNEIMLNEETTENPVVTEQIEEQPETPETLTAETTEEKLPIPPKPEWRMREDAERARAAEAELANERAEKAAMRQELEAMRRANQPKAEPVEKPAEPDPLLDPKGYAKHLRDEIREEVLAERREESLQRAAEANPDEFKEAYAAARQAVDPALKARMQSSRDPGKTLLEWHRENKIKAEVGNDPAAYRKRVSDELLKDPEFRKHAQTTWQSETQLPNGRPRVELPPSLNSTSRANTSLKSSSDDVSDEELFRELAG